MLNHSIVCYVLCDAALAVVYDSAHLNKYCLLTLYRPAWGAGCEGFDIMAQLGHCHRECGPSVALTLNGTFPLKGHAESLAMIIFRLGSAVQKLLDLISFLRTVRLSLITTCH